MKPYIYHYKDKNLEKLIAVAWGAFLIGLFMGLLVALMIVLSYEKEPLIESEVISPLPKNTATPTVTPTEAPKPKSINIVPQAEASSKSYYLKPNVPQWRSLVAKYFPADQVDYALAIISCESSGNPSAVSPTNDHGLFQIHNGLDAYGSQIYDPEFNISIAYNNYFKTRGWQPWYCRFRI